MYYVQHSKAYGHYLMFYPPGHSLHNLKYAWTLEWEKRERFQTEEAARKAIEHILVTPGEWIIRKER